MSAVRVGSLCYTGGCLFFLRLCSRGFQDLLRLNPPSLLMLFGCISISMASLTRLMEPIEGSETSAFKSQTPGKYPKENMLHKEHGESLKSRLKFLPKVRSFPNMSFLDNMAIISQGSNDTFYLSSRHHDCTAGHCLNL